jgi:tetratricopeptide (TPR) repeat protein
MGLRGFLVGLLVIASLSVAHAAPCSVAQGQALIDGGLYKRAIREFTCVIEAEPTEIAGYRGRIEAELLLGRFSDAALDYAQLMRKVVPLHPDASLTIFAEYDARLASAPDDIPALTGAGFAHWWFFDYPGAIRILTDLLAVRPDDVFGNLFRGSSRVLKGASRAEGAADLEYAIALAPDSPDVHFIAADAYTYGSLADPVRAFAEASIALAGGLDTPRVHAMLGAAYNAFGNTAQAAVEIETHIDAVTAELVPTAPLAPGTSMTLDLVPSRTFEIPVEAVAGQTLSVATSSPDFWDTILVLLAPDGTLVLGSDDAFKYLAAFEWVPAVSGTYRIRVTSFEAVSAGDLVVKRD